MGAGMVAYLTALGGKKTLPPRKIAQGRWRLPTLVLPSYSGRLRGRYFQSASLLVMLSGCGCVFFLWGGNSYFDGAVLTNSDNITVV